MKPEQAQTTLRPKPRGWTLPMIAIDPQSAALRRLDEIRHLCPDMRLGQVLATVGILGEDSTGRSLWDIDDDALLAAVERFVGDLSRRMEAQNK